MSENKTVRRSVAVGLGMVCVVVVAGLVGAFAYYHYTPIISGKDTTISSLNAEISQLNSTLLSLQEQVGANNLTINSLKANVTNLEDQLNGILNGTGIPLGTITSNPSAWVNMTVIVEGNLSGPLILPTLEYSPWNWELSSGGQTIGVSLMGAILVNANASFWNQFWLDSSAPFVRIYGLVEKGEITTTGNIIPPEVTYYIEGLTVEPL